MIGRDSIRPQAIPLAGLSYVMGYDNGPISQWPAAAWSRFEGIRQAHIDTQGDHPESHILDVERGDATVGSAVGWVRAARSLRSPGAYPPILYCNRATLPGLKAMMANYSLPLVTAYRLGVATLDGTKTIPDMTGVVYVQYASAGMTGGDYDESIVYDTSWLAPGSAASAPPGYLAVKVAPWARVPPWDSTLFGIAQHYGYGTQWELVWEDPQNEHLRELRKTPNLIQPGDVVYVRA